jgi:hypothetical protein
MAIILITTNSSMRVKADGASGFGKDEGALMIRGKYRIEWSCREAVSCRIAFGLD